MGTNKYVSIILLVNKKMNNIRDPNKVFPPIRCMYDKKKPMSKWLPLFSKPILKNKIK